MPRPINLGPLTELAKAAGGMQVLSERLGISRSTLSRFNNGEPMPENIRLALESMARELGVGQKVEPPDYLLAAILAAGNIAAGNGFKPAEAVEMARALKRCQ